jgi:hypothetical protein
MYNSDKEKIKMTKLERKYNRYLKVCKLTDDSDDLDLFDEYERLQIELSEMLFDYWIKGRLQIIRNK